MTSKNVTTATKALDAELEARHQEQADIAAYLESLDTVIEKARAIKQLYKREVAVEASRKSRAKKKAEFEEMQRRLAELEGA